MWNHSSISASVGSLRNNAPAITVIFLLRDMKSV
jgi:hypothetical protein